MIAVAKVETEEAEVATMTDLAMTIVAEAVIVVATEVAADDIKVLRN